MNAPALSLLKKGLQHLHLSTHPEAFMNYLILLHKWNQSYNLTAVRDIEVMVSRHIQDSLTILPWVHGSYLLDVGSGAGLPGIPLALAKPEIQFVLIDSNGKKTRFMQEAKRLLQLDNVEIVQTRVENYKPLKGFDTVITRAFSNLEKMISSTEHLLLNGGKWLAMKGQYPESELQLINYPYKVMHYTVFGMDSDRCCVLIDKP